MKDDIREYARIGLVHHMLHPGCMEDPDDHERTLGSFAGRGDIETFDCCLPYGDERRARLIPIIRNCGKEDVAFAAHLFPFRKLSFAEPNPNERAQVRMIVKDMVDCAAAIGATGFVFPSGRPPPAEASPAHYAAFADFCRWLSGELEPHGITALLEPFDTDVDKKFLYGSTRACVELIESLRPGVPNLGIELDLAHLPLMGETFEEAIRTVAPYLKRVHLGNCVFSDESHPLYGDKHPPIGVEGGEIDVPEVAGILRCLLEAGYLGREERGCLVMEMTPWPGFHVGTEKDRTYRPGKTVEETVADSFERLGAAWREVVPGR